MTHQVHEDGIRVATAADVLPDLLDPIDYRVDGLVTNTPGLALTIYYADCIPVLLYDPVGKAIAAVHSGWRGTSLGIAPKAVAKMTALYGTRPGTFWPPSAQGLAPAALRPTTMSPPRWRTGWGRRSGPSATPWNRRRASSPWTSRASSPGNCAGMGLAEEHIDTLPLCTACHPELYWSHRKMGDTPP